MNILVEAGSGLKGYSNGAKTQLAYASINKAVRR